MGGNVQTEGIFRVSPPIRIKVIAKEAYDIGQKYILWKDNGQTLPLPLYQWADPTDDLLDHIDPSEAYGVHLAAALIKSWYSDLREPIVPQSAYRDLASVFGDSDPQIDQLIDLLASYSEWSCLPPTSREILTRHLLPMLHEVVQHKEANQMTVQNLAVCFAPTLLCGPDQMEDVKMTGPVRKMLILAIESWPAIRDILGLSIVGFGCDIGNPPNYIDDYEDPEEYPPSTKDDAADDHSHVQGIILQDNTTSESDPPSSAEITPPALPPRLIPSPAPAPPSLPPRLLDTKPPALPPRRQPPTSAPAPTGDDAALRRRPVPLSPLATNTDPGPASHPAEEPDPLRPDTPPPRYSLVVGTRPGGVSDGGIIFGSDDVGPAAGVAQLQLAESPASYYRPEGAANGFAPRRRGDWSVRSAGSSVRGSDGEESPAVEAPLVRDALAAATAAAAAAQPAAVRRKPVGAVDDRKAVDKKG
jgi:Rho GTPase-activating protein 1